VEQTLSTPLFIVFFNQLLTAQLMNYLQFAA